MYIEPNTTIKILKDVPLDPTYDHTIYFSTEDAQYSWFTDRMKYTLPRNTYQRVQRGYMRVNIQAENLYDCNYLMFQNSAFGTKWFYAFIKSVEYINNGVSQIEFEIDVMQTWHFQYELEQCFVEREHTSTDEIGDNIVPENLELGEDVISNGLTTFDFNTMNVCILVSRRKNENPALSGKTINNVYTPLAVAAGLPNTDPLTLGQYIYGDGGLIDEGQEDRIVTIYQYPRQLGDASTTEPWTGEYGVPVNKTSLDGYVPRNNKLFTYPYNFILCSNNAGQTAVYRYEYFDNLRDAVPFRCTGVFMSIPCVIEYPRNYRGIENDYDSGLTLSNFPQCPWVGDAFKAWWAQNKASVSTSIISSVMSGVLATAGSAVIGPAWGAATAANSIATVKSDVKSVLAKVKDLKNTPPQVHGQAQTESLNAGMRRIEFSFYNMSIKAEFAKIVDDYFTRYGYAVRQNKVPNRNVRPHWTYTKTIACTIRGSIPADDARKICDIYDNGITFWMRGGEVGDYSLDNSLTGGD